MAKILQEETMEAKHSTTQLSDKMENQLTCKD